MSLLSRLRRVLSRPPSSRPEVSREEFEGLKETLERTRAQLSVVSDRVGSCPAPSPIWSPDPREAFEREGGVTEYLSPLPWEVRVNVGGKSILLIFVPQAMNALRGEVSVLGGNEFGFVGLGLHPFACIADARPHYKRLAETALAQLERA